MELKLKKITLDHFKGAEHKEICFNDGLTKICGVNSSGKTTISDSWFFVMANTNTALVKNPNITPIGSEDCKSNVEIELAIDDKPITLKKVQTFKTKESDGKITTSVTNKYFINDIDKTESAFNKELTEKGISMDKILVLSNPNAFLSDTSANGRKKIREILFQMAGDFSDKDLANDLGFTDIAEQLDSYSLDEIKAKSKAAIKKITDSHGANNELIESKIQGLMSAKSKANIGELQVKKDSVSEKIQNIISQLAGGDVKVETELNELKRQADSIAENEKAELRNQKDMIIANHNKLMKRKNEIESDLDNNVDLLNNLNANLASLRSEYQAVQDEVFDDETTICPTCGNRFKADKIDEMKQAFADSKKNRLVALKSKGEEVKTKRDNLLAEIDSLKYELVAVESAERDTLCQLDNLQVQIESYNALNNKEYKEIINKISELEKKLTPKTKDEMAELNTKLNEGYEELDRIKGELAITKNNESLDEQIKQLKEDRRQGEIRKAEAEKILNQVSQLELEKNTRLTSEINSKFKLVDWKLYEYQRNGEVKEICEPLIDNKPMNSCANGSLITLCKISICADLQEYFNQIVPIWCDDYSLFSSNTYSRIDVKGQLVGLIVTEDKELVVK